MTGGGAARSRRAAAVLLALTAGAAVAAPSGAAGTRPYARSWLLQGHETRHGLGVRVAAAGDVNGDRVPDLLVSATSSVHGALSGSVYVVFGQRGTGTTTITRARGFRIDGAAAHDSAVVAAAGGDVNGDGLGDVLVGAPKADVGSDETGAAYVVFGKSSAAPVTLGAQGDWGYRISGALPGDQAGTAVASAGDVNGDGVPDQLVGAPEASDLGRAQAGTVYVVHGQRQPAEVRLALVGIDPRLGHRIVGARAGDALGSAVAAVPDVDGDGAQEVVAGAPHAAPEARAGAGAAYVVTGSPALPVVDVATADVLTIKGATPQGGLGYAVHAAPKLVPGARAGIVVGAPGLLRQVAGAAAATRSAAADGAGSVHVLGVGAATGTVDLAQPPAGSLRIDGATAGQHVGEAVAVVPDSDRDGIEDLVLGGVGIDAPPAAYLVYGGRRGVVRLDRSFGGVRLTGPEGSAFGAAVAAVGDLDGDRRPELVIGAPARTVAGRAGAGEVRVVFSAAAAAPRTAPPRPSPRPPAGEPLPATGAPAWVGLAAFASALAALSRRLLT